VTAPPDPLAIARAYFASRGDEAFLVGGRLRDALLGRRTIDTDLAVRGGAIAHARAIARSSGGSFVPLDVARDVGRVVWPPAGGAAAVLDIARFTGPDLVGDLAARDFTINALALPLGAAADGLEVPTNAAAWPGVAESSQLPPSPDLATSPDVRRSLRQAVVDPTGGLADLDAGRIRMNGAAALDSDPLRMMRAARLAAELGFTIDPPTAAAIRSRAALVRDPAGERVREELLRLLAAPSAARHVRLLDDLGLLDHVLPEVTATRGVTQPPPHDRDVFDHSLGVLAAMEHIQARIRDRSAAETGPEPGGAPVSGASGPHDRPTASAGPGRFVFPAAWDTVIARHRPGLVAHLAEPGALGPPGRAVWQRLAALLHDIGKPTTWMFDPAVHRIRFPQHDQAGATLAEGVAARLKLSGGARDYLVTVIQHHLRPLYLATADAPPSDRWVYRYFQSCGGAGVDIAALSLADNAAKAGVGPADAAAFAGVADRLLGAWFEAHDRVIAPRPFVSGDDLIQALGLAPGPAVGRLLSVIREEQAAGEVRDAAEALALARRWLAEVGH